MSESDERDTGASLRTRRGLSRRTFLGRAAAVGGVAIGGAALAACTPSAPQGSPSASSSSTVVKGGHVTEGRVDEPITFNPMQSLAVSSDLIGQYCFDALVCHAPSGDVIPLMAKSLPKISSDGLTLTFDLRDDVKWSDGRPVTSKDVLFTYNTAFDPKYKAFPSRYRATMENYVARMATPDDRTFVIEMKKVYAPFLSTYLPYFGILPEHVLGTLTAEQLTTSEFNRAPSVVNGIFKFVRWDKGQQITFERNPTYYRGAANINTYIYKVVPSTAAMLNQLLTGEVDFGEVDPVQAQQVGQSQGLTVHTLQKNQVMVFGIQVDPARRASKLFGDKVVRQALIYAANRDQMVKAIYDGKAEVAHSMIAPWSWAASSNVQPKYTYDKAKAEALLDGAGWRKGTDGIRQKDGTRMEFAILSYASRDKRPSEALQAAWKEIGLDVTLNMAENNVVNNTILQHKDEWDIWVGEPNLRPDPDNSAYLHSREIINGGVNIPGYRNATIDKMLDDAVSTVDQAKRKEIYVNTQNILAEELPYGPLFFTTVFVGASQRVQNMKQTTFLRYLRPWMNELYVSDGK